MVASLGIALGTLVVVQVPILELLPLDGEVFFKNRYVRTPKYVDETREQRIMYRGFGTQIPGGVRA